MRTLAAARARVRNVVGNWWVINKKQMLAPSSSHHPMPSRPAIHPHTPWTGEAGGGLQPSTRSPWRPYVPRDTSTLLALKPKRAEQRVLSPAQATSV